MHISFAIQTGETAPALPGKYLWIFRRKKKIYKISNRRSKSCKSKVLKYTKAVVKSYSHYDFRYVCSPFIGVLRLFAHFMKAIILVSQCTLRLKALHHLYMGS